MSHYFNLVCPVCNDSSVDANRGDDRLRQAVQNITPLIEAHRLGWNIEDADWEMCRVGGWIVQHVTECKAAHFDLKDEYQAEPVEQIPVPEHAPCPPPSAKS